MTESYEQQTYREGIEELDKLFHVKQMAEMNDKIKLALRLSRFEKSRRDDEGVSANERRIKIPSYRRDHCN